MALPVVGLREMFRDRIQWMALLLVASFVAVLSLTSQSGASYPTYALTLLMLATFPQWRDVLKQSLLRWVFALLVWLSLSAFWFCRARFHLISSLPLSREPRLVSFSELFSPARQASSPENSDGWLQIC